MPVFLGVQCTSLLFPHSRHDPIAIYFPNSCLNYDLSPKSCNCRYGNNSLHVLSTYWVPNRIQELRVHQLTKSTGDPVWQGRLSWSMVPSESCGTEVERLAQGLSGSDRGRQAGSTTDRAENTLHLHVLLFTGELAPPSPQHTLRSVSQPELLLEGVFQWPARDSAYVSAHTHTHAYAH